MCTFLFFFFQAEDGIRDIGVTGVQTCALPIFAETYIKIRGQWRYLYRAIDKRDTPVDFLLTAKRDLEAAKRLFRKMLQDQPLLSPDRIGTDGAGSYPQIGRASCRERV